LAVATLHLKDEAASKAYFEWTDAVAKPCFLSFEEFLRTQYFKATHADITENGRQVQGKTSKNTLVLMELDGDDWIFDALMEISDSEGWRAMEDSLVCLTLCSA
jgi:hypothetical protein